MKIHADLAERAIVNSNQLPWVDSPLPGVQRRMLDRDGAEVARATSIVRYAPGSWFEAHSHDGGEEFLVLEGVFSDEMGDFHQGMYVRNPIGSRHKPHTREGTIILVKLRQFDPDDQAFVRIDTTSAEWLPGEAPGLQVMPLHSFGEENVALQKWEPGTALAEKAYSGGIELFVLSGQFADEYGSYRQGTWVRHPAGSRVTGVSEEGCVLFVKTGHL
jgi:anti-sigma factor ChrR (cupin superfamily)